MNELGWLKDAFAIGTPIFLFGGLAYMVRQLTKDVGDIKGDLKLLNKVVMDVALSNQRQDNFEKRTDDRFKHMEDDLRELKHGDGFISARTATQEGPRGR